MSHWFDRLAKTAAGDGGGLSRRGMLKTAGVAAFAASPLASPIAARAAIEIEGRAASVACDACVTGTINAHNATMRRCDKTGSMWGTVPKGKSKKAPRPVSAAKRLACALKERAEFAHDLNFCRQNPCAGQPNRPLVLDPDSPFPPGTPGGTACPGGTNRCPDGSCCYGGDLCCPCASASGQGGFICCVAVIGCTCCG